MRWWVPLLLLQVLSATCAAADAAGPQETPEAAQAAPEEAQGAPEVPQEAADAQPCAEEGTEGTIGATSYVCLEEDLIDAAYFESGGGISLADGAAPAPDSQEAAPAADPPPPGRLTADPVPTNPTAFIDVALVWPDQGTAARVNGNNVLEIPVCWVNPTAADREGRERTELAVRNTWEAQQVPIRFIRWTQCLPGARGGIRIQIADENPRAYVGRVADRQPIGMWLNFTFDAWSPACKQRQRAGAVNPRGRITWENCVYSIAVHEFGHALGFLHEHNRLFHSVRYHQLSEAERQRNIQLCAARGVRGATSNQPPQNVILTGYDPLSPMNYCFNIYDHEVQPTAYDIGALRRAYSRQR